MTRIRFLSAQVYDTGGPGKGPKFPAGFVLDQADVGKVLDTKVTDEWAEGFLRRWVRRNAAEYVDGRTPASAPEPAADATPADKQTQPPPAVPLGTEARGRPTAGLDDGKQVQRTEDKPAPEPAKPDALKTSDVKPAAAPAPRR